MASKRMKRSLGDEIVVNITPAKKIVDINIDCLESVFNFLDISDLINVAEASKHLQAAAEMVFKRKLTKRMIYVDNDWYNLIKHPNISIYDNAVCIRVPLLGFKIIRLFGQHISELCVRITKSETLRKYFFIHVNEYCHKALNILHVHGDHSDIFGAAEHPFGIVEKFTYHTGPIGCGCEHFNRLFPRLRQLKLNYNPVLNSKYILQAFPYLDTFTLLSYNSKSKRLTKSDLNTIATLNPQLKSFTLDRIGRHNLHIWKSFSEKLKDLKRIGIKYELKYVERFKDTPILFNDVEIFNVYCDAPFVSRTHTVNPIDVFRFLRLKKITVICRLDELEMWLDFVLAHPTMEQFEIFEYWGDPFPTYFETLENLREKFNKVRRNLKFISIRYHDNTFDDGHIKEIPTFLENYQWFDELSVSFNDDLTIITKSTLESFYKEIPQIKNYETKKHFLIFKNNCRDMHHEMYITLKKCKT